jgi:hypothetical protein
MKGQLFLYSMLGTMFDTHSKLLAELRVLFLSSAFRKANGTIKVFEKYSGTSVHERPCSRTIRFTNNFSEQKPSRMTNGVSDYEHASWQQRQAESIGAGVSVAG